jgi:hypothetical protein
LKELGAVAFANMASYVTITDDGRPVLDFSGVTIDQMAAISEIVQEEDNLARGEGVQLSVRKTRFKLHNKLTALEALAKHFNLFGTTDPTDLAEKAAMAQAMIRAGRAQERGHVNGHDANGAAHDSVD